MIVDVSPAFAQGYRGLTIFRRDSDFMVSVKTSLGGFVIGYGQTPADGLSDALKRPRTDDALFGDLL